MNKKLRYIAMTFVSIILVCCYIVRISYVNKDNAKAEVEYVSDSKSVQAGNLKIEVAEQKLYDVAEYVKEYPEIRNLYTYKGSYYEKFDGGNDVLRSYKKIFFIVLKVTNTGDKTEEIPYFEYKLYVDKNYAFDFYPTEVEYINKFRIIIRFYIFCMRQFYIFHHRIPRYHNRVIHILQIFINVFIKNPVAYLIYQFNLI